MAANSNWPIRRRWVHDFPASRLGAGPCLEAAVEAVDRGRILNEIDDNIDFV